MESSKTEIQGTAEAYPTKTHKSTLSCKICAVRQYCWEQPNWNIHYCYTELQHWPWFYWSVKWAGECEYVCLKSKLQSLTRYLSPIWRNSWLTFELLSIRSSHRQMQPFIFNFCTQNTRAYTEARGDRSCLQLTGVYISKVIKPPTPTLPPPWPYNHAMMRDATVCSLTALLIQPHNSKADMFDVEIHKKNTKENTI